MSAMRMKVARCPTDELSLYNCAVINHDDFPDYVRHIEVTTAPNHHFVFATMKDEKIHRGTVGFNLPQRRWATLSIDQDIEVGPYDFDSISSTEYLSTIVLEVDFLQKEVITSEPYDTDEMACCFTLLFSDQAFTEGQQLAFQFNDKMLCLVVKSLEATEFTIENSGRNAEPKKTKMGLCGRDTTIKFVKAENSSLYLVGMAKAFGTSAAALEPLLTRGIIVFTRQITNNLEDVDYYIKEARAAVGSGLLSVLLEGPPNSGKTALAAHIAKKSDFPFMKVCTPEDMLGFTEKRKCLTIRKVFDDAYRSQHSCILVDNIEGLLDYCPIGPRYSNLTLQVLLVLLKKQPPPGHKLLLLCTTSRRQVLDDMGILSGFSRTIHVPNVTTLFDLLDVLEEFVIFTKEEMKSLQEELEGKRIFIGIKKLLSLIDMAHQVEYYYRIPKFISKLKDEGALE